MYVECLIKRVGVTPVILGKTKYLFMPIPDPSRKAGQPSTSFCEITAEEHLAYLLKLDEDGKPKLDKDGFPLAKQYREYNPNARPEPKEKVIDMHGYAITKHQEGRTEGYRCEDNRNKKDRRYAGVSGWQVGLQGLVPFATEFEAWQWLKSEIDTGEDGPSEDVDFMELAGRKKKSA
jgi:hypothetical protein